MINQLSPYAESMAAEIADLFHAAVHAIDERIYTVEQKEAWAPLPIDKIKWQTRLNQKRPHVALVGPMIAGFIERSGQILVNYSMELMLQI